MEILEILYLNHPLSFKDLFLVFLITLIAVPIIYIKTGKKIKLMLKLYIFFFFLVAVFTPLFVFFIFFMFSVSQIIFFYLGILPESIYKVDYKDIRLATNMLPISCAVWYITSIVLTIKLGKSYND